MPELEAIPVKEQVVSEPPVTDEVKQQINTTVLADTHVPEYLLSSKDESNDQPFDNSWTKSSD